ncbi:hypothetical protein BF49_3582 [Bradyrhizobium sp.]|uniref:hypothetical protein n=1 Tax=Bradyrhizobium sp. TaxID=376 RepID=UPI0007C1D2F4|nr:hypothetical protein [Bradyrhizobium sp.]CUT12502.1 hypothetical protein BF49_3582 [Bradyrhizobium sp.]
MARASLRNALIAASWDGFQTAGAIADRLEHWSVATVAERLRALAAEGLLWSVVEAGQTRTCKFAHVRTDTAAMVIPAGRSARRSWRPIRKVAA